MLRHRMCFSLIHGCFNSVLNEDGNDTVFQPHKIMISRLLLALVVAITVSSCASTDFRLASRQGEAMECYSTWNYLPPNT